jgi:hypothetical protein
VFKKLISTSVLVASITGSAVFAADSCDELTTRLTFNADGTITDSKTKLTWQQCNLGQNWTDGACSGQSSKFDFQIAQDEVKSNGKGFRLPTLTELLDVTHYECGEPAVVKNWTSINPGFYWTSTEAFGGFRNTVLMTTGEEYPMGIEIEASLILVK